MFNDNEKLNWVYLFKGLLYVVLFYLYRYMFGNFCLFFLKLDYIYICMDKIDK